MKNIHSPGRKPKPIPADLLSMYKIMTQAQLAKHYSVSRTTINKWLRQSNISVINSTITINDTGGIKNNG